MDHYSALVLLVLALFNSCHSSMGLQKACGKNPLDDMDDLISSIMPFGNTKAKAPAKVEDLPDFCRFYGEALSRVESMNKRCMKDSYRNMISVIVFNVKKNTKELCSKKSLESKELTTKKKNLLQLGGCIQSGAEQLSRCATASNSKVVGIQNAEKEKKLPLLCCELIQIQKCILQALSQQPGCSAEESAQRIKQYVANFGTNTISSVCAEHNSEDKCKGLNYPKKKKSQRVPKSFIMPILTVVSSI